jgi:hypothetical protein
MRNGVPTVALVNRSMEWKSRLINWGLLPQWQVELTLVTVGHLRYNPDGTYVFSAPPLEI